MASFQGGGNRGNNSGRGDKGKRTAPPTVSSYPLYNCLSLDFDCSNSIDVKNLNNKVKIEMK